MKTVLLCLLVMTTFSFSKGEPKVAIYNYGHNGMELVARSKKGTIIVSTFNAKMTIRKDIASRLYDLYLANKLENNKKITVNGCEADVTGKCIIRKKDNLTVVDFYYEVVEWNSGLKEIYKRVS